MTANILRTVLLDVLLPIGAYFGLVSQNEPGVSCQQGDQQAEHEPDQDEEAEGRQLAGTHPSGAERDDRDARGRGQRPRRREPPAHQAARFDDEWVRNSAFRRVHRRLTALWVAGLVGEVIVAVVVVYTTPLAVAVITTGVLTPAVLLTLIAVTQVRAGQPTLRR